MDGASILKEFLGADPPAPRGTDEPTTGADILRAFLDQPDPVKPKPDAAPPASLGVDDFGRPIPDVSGQLGMTAPSHIPTTIPEMRAALAPPEGYIPRNVLPFAVKEVAPGVGDMSAGVKLDPGNMLRSLGTGALDLLEGTGQAGPSPLAGTITPEGTMALMSLAGTRFARSPAAGTAQAIADTAELGAPRAVIAGRNRMGVDAAGMPPGAPTMAPGMASATGARPGMGGPEPPPNSVGAMGTPGNLGAIPADEAGAIASQAEIGKLRETQAVGVRDPAVYVEGVNPTVAHVEQTVNASREIKDLATRNRALSQEERELADAHNEARKAHFNDIAGSQTDLANARKLRDDKTAAQLGEVWANKGVANAQPVMDVGEEILNGPDGKRDLVAREVKGVMDKLRKRGSDVLEDDPEQLYGVRKHINDRLSKEAAIDDPQVVRAQAALLKMKEAIDAAIEPAANGFKAVMERHAAESRPIDAMAALQEAEPKLFDAQGRLRYSNVQNLMRQIVYARTPDAALSRWASLTPEQMDGLWALRDDLRRVASAEDLARAKGSDTAQNVFDAAKALGKAGLMRAVGAVPVVGPGLRVGQELSEPYRAARQSAADLRKGRNLLYNAPTNRMNVPPPAP